jgi:hypothetical protein
MGINWVTQTKLLWTITFISELGFEKTNSFWRGLEKKKGYVNPKF